MSIKTSVKQSFKVGVSRLRKFFAKLNFSPALLEKIPSFVCLADLKANCTRLWRFVLMIAYNMLTKKYYFC